MTLRHMFGAKSIQEAPSSNMEESTSCAVARRFAKDQAVLYLSAGRAQFGNPPALHLTIDGVQAAGDNSNVFFVAWLSRRNLVGVPPNQVASNTFLRQFFGTPQHACQGFRPEIQHAWGGFSSQDAGPGVPQLEISFDDPKPRKQNPPETCR